MGGVTPLVTFHRGDCTVAPENTLPAFRSAILKGGDRIELDVWSFNEEALKFYEAVGFQTYRRFMALPATQECAQT